MELAARGGLGAACALHRARRHSYAAVAAPVPPPRCPAAAAAASARFPAPRRLRVRAQSGIVPHESSGEGDGAPALDPSQVASIPLPTARRRTQMTFTCNKCGVRSTRLVNPEALARGTVFVQCSYEPCAVWHKVADGFDWWGDEFTDLQGKQAQQGEAGAPTQQP